MVLFITLTSKTFRSINAPCLFHFVISMIQHMLVQTSLVIWYKDFYDIYHWIVFIQD